MHCDLRCELGSLGPSHLISALASLVPTLASPRHRCAPQGEAAAADDKAPAGKGKKKEGKGGKKKEGKGGGKGGRGPKPEVGVLLLEDWFAGCCPHRCAATARRRTLPPVARQQPQQAPHPRRRRSRTRSSCEGGDA